MTEITFLKLHILLLERGLKLTNIGRELGFSSATVSKINDNKYVSLDTIVRLATYLGVDIGDIVAIKKDPNQ